MSAESSVGGDKITAERGTSVHSTSTISPRQKMLSRWAAHARPFQRRLVHQIGENEIKAMKDYLRVQRSITKKDFDELDCLERQTEIEIFETDGDNVLIETFTAIDEQALARQVEHQKQLCRHAGVLTSRAARDPEESGAGKQPAGGGRSHESPSGESGASKQPAGGVPHKSPWAGESGASKQPAGGVPHKSPWAGDRAPWKQERRQNTIHAQLVQYLTDEMTADMVKEMKDYLRTRKVISPRNHDELDGVHDIIECLLSKREIVKGKKDGYALLIETLQALGQNALARIVENCQDKLWRNSSNSSSEEATEQPTTEQSRESPAEAGGGKNLGEKPSYAKLEETLSQFSDGLKAVKTQCDEELLMGQNIRTTLNEQQTHFTEIKSTLSEIQHDINSAKNKDDIERALQAAIQQESELGVRVNEVMMLSGQLNAEKERQVKYSTEMMEQLTQYKELFNETMKKNKERELELENSNITPYAQILLNGKEEEIKSLEKELSELQEKIATYRERELVNKNAELELSDLKTQLVTKTDEFKTELQRANKENENLKDQFRGLQAERDSARKDHESLKEQLRILVDQSRGAQSELDSSRKENRLLKSQVGSYERNLTTKENDNKRLQEELETTKMEKTELQEVLHTVTKENTELQVELDTTKMEKTELQEELDTTKREKTELQEELDSTKRETTELQEELHTTEMENTELQEELADTTTKELAEQEQGGGVQGAVGGTADIQRYQGQEGVQLAKGPRDIERCREVFKKEYGTIIRSIVNLGDRFAVAYGPYGDEIKGVDIYNISGVKQRTLEDNIKGLLHLAVTPDKGTLVAVCDEGRLGPYTIREIDPVRGRHIRSTPQFKVDGDVWGFDVCDGQQFVILHGDWDKVTFVNEDGSVVLTEKVKSSSHFISCGGRHVFLSRDGHYVDVYEITEDRHLKRIAISQHFDRVGDVSATAAGEVTVTCKRGLERGRRYCLGRSTFKDNKFSEWKYKHVDSRVQVLVSVGGDHVVVAGWDNNARMRILRVFKEEAV